LQIVIAHLLRLAHAVPAFVSGCRLPACTPACLPACYCYLPAAWVCVFVSCLPFCDTCHACLRCRYRSAPLPRVYLRCRCLRCRMVCHLRYLPFSGACLPRSAVSAVLPFILYVLDLPDLPRLPASCQICLPFRLRITRAPRACRARAVRVSRRWNLPCCRRLPLPAVSSPACLLPACLPPYLLASRSLIVAVSLPFCLPLACLLLQICARRYTAAACRVLPFLCRSCTAASDYCTFRFCLVRFCRYGFTADCLQTFGLHLCRGYHSCKHCVLVDSAATLPACRLQRPATALAPPSLRLLAALRLVRFSDLLRSVSGFLPPLRWMLRGSCLPHRFLPVSLTSFYCLPAFLPLFCPPAATCLCVSAAACLDYRFGSAGLDALRCRLLILNAAPPAAVCRAALLPPAAVHSFSAGCLPDYLFACCRCRFSGHLALPQICHLRAFSPRAFWFCCTSLPAPAAFCVLCTVSPALPFCRYHLPFRSNTVSAACRVSCLQTGAANASAGLPLPCRLPPLPCLVSAVLRSVSACTSHCRACRAAYCLPAV